MILLSIPFFTLLVTIVKAVTHDNVQTLPAALNAQSQTIQLSPDQLATLLQYDAPTKEEPLVVSPHRVSVVNPLTLPVIPEPEPNPTVPAAPHGEPVRWPGAVDPPNVEVNVRPEPPVVVEDRNSQINEFSNRQPDSNPANNRPNYQHSETSINYNAGGRDPWLTKGSSVVPSAFQDGKRRAEAAAEAWILEYEAKASKIYYESVTAGWNYFTNVTEHNRHKLMETEIRLGEFQRASAEAAKQFPWVSFQNTTTRRVLEKLSREGMSSLPKQKFLKYTELQSEMAQIFGNATVCENGRPPPCSLRLEPDINRIMSSSRDFGTLYYLWEAWRNAVGPRMRPKFIQFAELANEGALLNGYHDTGDMWRAQYESRDLEDRLEKVFDKLLPFYKQLHAYVRRRLSRMYPGYLFKDGPMPAHLLGNMWANSWLYLYEYTTPYPGKWSFNPTTAMLQQNFTVERLFAEAEKFYKSIGFDALPDHFWQKSMFVQPPDRSVVCLPAAVDFRDGKDFRVKMCSGVSSDDFIQAHHQLGHIYYYLAYKDLPLAFRDGANPAFHDAVGSTVSMFVRTQEHLVKLGLLPHVDEDPGTAASVIIAHDINSIN